MSMSLDMIGKFVLITILIAVATGLILNFESGIMDSVNNILGGGEDPQQNSKVVTISSSSPTQKIASLVDACYQRYLENSYESYVCSIARKDSGTMSISESELRSQLSSDVRSKLDMPSNINSATTILVRYDKDLGKIRVEK